jgi:cyclase
VEKHEISSGLIAFIDPGGRSNCGMIYTTEGIVLIDTTSRLNDMRKCMEFVEITPNDVCLIFVTHSHNDHLSGIPLFRCTILAHNLTYQLIGKRDTKRAKKLMPSDTFEHRKELEIGGTKLQMIHVGGHTPDSSIVWLPNEQILFAGDLIFEGRYPYLASANVEKLMETLRWLPSLGARIIVPGHGLLCDNKEILKQLNYLETTWDRTAKHIEKGHSLDEALNDHQYPRYSDLNYEKRHLMNIKVIYQEIQIVARQNT